MKDVEEKTSMPLGKLGEINVKYHPIDLIIVTRLLNYASYNGRN